MKGLAGDDESKLALVKALLRGIYLCSAAETIAFASKCNLDLDQVFELCINAAGGSTIFETVGPEIIKLARGEQIAKGESESFKETIQQLQDAVEEAQRLKAPVYLGSQALTLTRLALQLIPEAAGEVSRAVVAKVWGL